MLTNFGNFPQMVEGSAADFSDVLLHGEMCVQGNAKVANGVRWGNGRVTEQKRNVQWFKFAGFRIADQNIGFWVVKLDEVVRLDRITLNWVKNLKLL